MDKRLKRVLSFGLAWAGAPGVVVGGLAGAMATSLSGAIACFSSSAEAKRLVGWACCLEDVADVWGCRGWMRGAPVAEVPDFLLGTTRRC